MKNLIIKTFVVIIIIIIILILILFYIMLIDILQNNKEYEIPQVKTFNNDFIYKNEDAGYQIIFPENWKGHYIVTEYSPDEVCIGFYGKSKTSQLAFKHSLGRNGLDMCWIVDEKHISGEGSLVWGKLGKIDKKEYYITSPRGGTYLPVLKEVFDTNSVFRETVKYNVDAVELELAEQDYEKSVPMRNDLYNLNFKFSKICE